MKLICQRERRVGKPRNLTRKFSLGYVWTFHQVEKIIEPALKGVLTGAFGTLQISLALALAPRDSHSKRKSQDHTSASAQGRVGQRTSKAAAQMLRNHLNIKWIWATSAVLQCPQELFLYDKEARANLSSLPLLLSTRLDVFIYLASQMFPLFLSQKTEQKQRLNWLCS